MVQLMMICVMLWTGLSSQALSAQERTIGEWDDTVGTAWRQNIKIVEEQGKLYRVSTFPTGRPVRFGLVEVKPLPGERRRFKVKENDESCAIASNGNLRLFDSDGFIREARRIR